MLVYEYDNISDIISPSALIFLPSTPVIDPPTNTTQTGIKYLIPAEWTIGLIVFTGVMVGVPILIIVNRKRKNPISESSN